ncbi:uncharacterized protein EKO05_0010459 [Ascochyta rabiei]|uniref:uncharacterized protein n=1 Tax=Didymella rabiei TaxID=5454 RepID=UPI00220DFE70|nr:uncharacterized protein EKO05_0010459 [Ascochyta rabiei]UPX20219.1 hypothetical protein EKO05_0010459 [Ascochyta rabiei]
MYSMPPVYADIHDHKGIGFAGSPPNQTSMKVTVEHARRRQREHGSARGGKKRKAARHTGTCRCQLKGCCSPTRGLARGRARCWCSCRPRRSFSATSHFNREVPKITSSRCSCGERRQIIAYVLLRCSKHEYLRNRIFANLSGRHSLKTLLSTLQLATKAIKYIEQTQILRQVGIRDTQTTLSVGGRL